MQIAQKKMSNRHLFTFNDESLNFAYSDKSGSGDIDIPYAHFPQKSFIKIDRNDWLRNVGILWLIIGVLQFGTALYAGHFASATMLWLTLGTICLAWAHYSKVKYTVYQAEKGSVYVIQDRNTHDRIIEEIRSRRKKQLLDWYGEIDTDNAPENEIEKFKWLCEQEVISKHEAEQKISQVQLAHTIAAANSPTRLN